jgi:DNA-binding cell septation regulator SpoVG
VKVTEVRIKAASGFDNDRLLAYAVVVFDDCFAVHDLKIIQGRDGPFLSMPSRKASARCICCSRKNDYQARRCQQCGRELPPPSGQIPKVHYDIAHPICRRFRDYLEGEVMAAYWRSRDCSTPAPTAVSGYDIDLDDYERRVN